jgi:thiol-disulfide isomerase/thioredoxin
MVLAVVVLSALAGFLSNRSDSAPPASPAKAPAKADAAAQLATRVLPDLEGKPQAISQWRGKIWVVNFWATWCTPCREEMPMLAKLSEAHRERVQFIGIGIDSAESMRKFAKDMPMPYPLLVGDNDMIEISARLGNDSMALPFTVVIDARGQIRGKRLGKITEAELLGLIER